LGGKKSSCCCLRSGKTEGGGESAKRDVIGKGKKKKAAVIERGVLLGGGGGQEKKNCAKLKVGGEITQQYRGLGKSKPKKTPEKRRRKNKDCPTRPARGGASMGQRPAGPGPE